MTDIDTGHSLVCIPVDREIPHLIEKIRCTGNPVVPIEKEFIDSRPAGITLNLMTVRQRTAIIGNGRNNPVDFPHFVHIYRRIEDGQRTDNDDDDGRCTGQDELAVHLFDHTHIRTPARDGKGLLHRR